MKTDIRKFRGMWAREPKESCPPDHLTDCHNCVFGSTSIKSRPALSTYSTFVPTIVRGILYKTDNQNDVLGSQNATRPILHFSDGTLVDVYRFGVTTIFTGSGSNDLTGISLYNRLYFGYYVPGTGIGSGNVKVYNGIHPAFVASSILRDAAGTAATNATTINASVAGGKLTNYGTTPGWYAFSVVYETDTGFIRQPGNWLIVYVNEAGFVKSNITLNIPLGPVGTAARIILGTKLQQSTAAETYAIANGVTGVSLPTSSANVTSEPPFELFTITRIANNVATTAVVSYLDDEIVNSADYLMDLKTTIPSGVKISEYNGRLIVLGGDDKDLFWASKSGEPEVFSASSSFREIEPNDPSGLKNAIEYRGNLYLFKGRTTIVTQDNTDECSTWEYTVIDNTIGTSPRGVANIFSSPRAPSEGFAVASHRGILFFNGTFQQRELTWKIETLWKRINPLYFDLVELHQDPIAKAIYAVVPLDSSTTCNYIIYGDYSEGLSPETIKWSYWTVNGFTDLRGMLLYEDKDTKAITTFVPVAQYVTLLNGVPASNLDFGSQAILNAIATSLIGDGESVNNFTRIRINILGSGPIFLRLYGKDNTPVSPDVAHILAAAPSRYYWYLVNFINEQAVLYIANSNTCRFELKDLTIEWAPLWDERPR